VSWIKCYYTVYYENWTLCMKKSKCQKIVEDVGRCEEAVEGVRRCRKCQKLQVIDWVMSWYMTVRPSYGQALEGCSEQ